MLDENLLNIIVTDLKKEIALNNDDIEDFLNKNNIHKTKYQISIKLILIKVYAEKYLNDLSNNNIDIIELNKIVEDAIKKYTETIIVIKK